MRTYDAETMIRISQLRSILKRGDRVPKKRLWIRDISGINSFGYIFQVVEQRQVFQEFKDEQERVIVSDWIWEDVRVIAKSRDTSFPGMRNKGGGIGAYGPSFDRDELAGVLA